MADYQLTNGNTIKRNSDGAFIPIDSNNRDYRVYLRWVSQGNTPDPADADADRAPQHLCNNLLLTLSEPTDPDHITLKSRLMALYS